MKPLFYTKTLVAMAVAIAAAAAAVSQAQEQPIPPPASDSALPSGIVPGSPLAEVVKMLHAGVDVSTIESYVQNSPTPFNLDADKILFLKDEGAPNDLINAMLDRDKALYAASQTPPPTPAPVVTSSPEAPATTTVATVDPAPPATEVTVNYFDNTLSPYGSWVEVEGYGRCWRPTVVAYDSAWAPYGDRGHWTYTDYGWYWDSDYAWGLTFHYGRWFNHARLGWCWYPDTVWAPSWVTWRSGGDYRGWAPLPPFAEFRPGIGFFYRGVSVGLDFDFGLRPEHFRFISTEHFGDLHPRGYFVERGRAEEVFHHTTGINHFEVRDHMVVNSGFGVEHITGVNHRPIETVHLRDLPNAGRQGWRGEGFERTMHPGSLSRDAGPSHDAGRGFAPGNGNGNNQFQHGPETMNPGNLHHDTPVPGTGGHPADHSYGQNPPGGNSQFHGMEAANAHHDTPAQGLPSHQTTYSAGASGQNSFSGNGQSSHTAGTYAPGSVAHSTPSASVVPGNQATTVRPGQNTYSAGQGNPGTMVRPGQSSSSGGYGAGVAHSTGGYQSSAPVQSHSPAAPAGGYQSPSAPSYNSAPAAPAASTHGGAQLQQHDSAPGHQAPAASAPASGQSSHGNGGSNNSNSGNNGHDNGR